jgi:hypothetical protein
LWLLLLLPDVRGFVHDADWGHQLAGANQILLLGEQPFIDWHSVYGPLVFYASALAQVFTGGRAIGEILLVVAGFATGYLILFTLVVRLTGTRWMGFVCVVMALLMVPRLYKYYLILGPVAVLAMTWAYLEERTTKRLVLLGASAGWLFLFRPDFGAYAGVVALFAVGRGDRPFRRIGILAASSLGAVAPWLFWATTHHALVGYVRDTFLGSRSLATGMAVPMPAISFGSSFPTPGTTTSLLIGLFTIAPGGAFLLLRFLGSGISAVRREQVLSSCVLAQLDLIQAYHRSDYPHLLQAIPVAFVPLFFMVSIAIETIRRPGSRFARNLALASTAPLALTLGLCLWSATGLRGALWLPRPRSSLPSLLNDLRVYSGPRQGVVDEVLRENPSDDESQAIAYLRNHTRVGERLLALPLLTSVYYLAERPFGGGQMLLAPGWFTSTDDQTRMVRLLREQDVDWLADVPDFMLDGDEKKRGRVFASVVYAYIDSQFTTAARFGPISVMRLGAKATSP